MAFYNEAWFIHAVNGAVEHLAQQKRSKTTGTMRTKDGVVGKTWPFNRLAAGEMEEMAGRDGDTQYINPTQSKRRAVLRDFGAAVLIDSFDEVKTLTSPTSEFTILLAAAIQRQRDRLALAIGGLGSAGADLGLVGGILGSATSVDEGAETKSLSALPAGQQIVNGGTNLTMAKIRQARRILNAADADEEESYMFYSPQGMEKFTADSTVTSSDYSSINALTNGTFPMDAMWMGFKWRMSNLLPKVSNIRSCIAFCKAGVGAAFGSVKEIEVGPAPHKWNNTQVIAKLSGGVVRVDDAMVVQIDIDESV